MSWLTFRRRPKLNKTTSLLVSNFFNSCYEFNVFIIYQLSSPDPFPAAM